MAIDWDRLLYGPMYKTHGVDAVLTIGAVAHVVRVIDNTQGVTIEQGGFALPELKPVACITQAELLRIGVAAHALHDQTLLVNATLWRIKNTYARPVEGKASGDWMLVLIKETM
jgi:hypothetical protein